MSDHIHIEKGRPPYAPSESSVVRTVYHRFTIPLVGLIVQDEVPYLYWCVVGHSAPESAWAYARLDRETDAARLGEVESCDFDAELRRLVKGRVCSFALASDDGGAIEWATIEPPADFDTAFERGMDEVRQKVSEAMAEMEQLMDRFPTLRRASAFAISPSPSVL